MSENLHPLAAVHIGVRRSPVPVVEPFSEGSLGKGGHHPGAAVRAPVRPLGMTIRRRTEPAPGRLLNREAA